MTPLEATNSVFVITDESSSITISIPGRWRIPNNFSEGIIDKLKNLLKPRSQNDIDLHVEEVRQKVDKPKMKSKEFSPSDFDTSKNEILEELKSAKYHDFEDLIFRLELTYDEIMDIIDIKHFKSKKTS